MIGVLVSGFGSGFSCLGVGFPGLDVFWCLIYC